MHIEGKFQLIAYVSKSIAVPGKWRSAGYIHASGEEDPIVRIPAGENFESETCAYEAAISAARDLAKTLHPDDSYAKRKAARGL